MSDATYEANTVPELQAEIDRREHLLRSGVTAKADLIKLLEKDDKATAKATPEPDGGTPGTEQLGRSPDDVKPSGETQTPAQAGPDVEEVDGSTPDVTVEEAVSALAHDEEVPVDPTVAAQAQTTAELDFAKIHARAAATALADSGPEPGDAGGSDVGFNDAGGDGTGPKVSDGADAGTDREPLLDENGDPLPANFTGGHKQSDVVATDDPRVRIIEGKHVIVGNQPDPTYDENDGLIGPKAERGPLGSPLAVDGEQPPAMIVPGHARAAEQALAERQEV